MKIDPGSAVSGSRLRIAGMSPGIFPYVGGSVSADQLRAIVSTYGGAIVPGKRGAQLAARTQHVLVDPAMYDPRAKSSSADALFDYDDWLMRQRAAGVPLILTDTPRIRNGDHSGLQKALARWDSIDEPTLVVLPIEPWWLQQGLSCLTEEVQAAGRPVAVVLLHRYNGLDATRVIAGLVTFVSAVGHVPVVQLRCDISGVGAVAYGSFAGFVGWSANTRHGPMPMRQPERGANDRERDESPGIFVPVLHDYFKASKLPAFVRGQRSDVLRCDDPVCAGSSLLRIAELNEVDPSAARTLARQHNMASAEHLGQRILSATEPHDAWWETCKGGADMRASLATDGINLPPRRWIRQWLEMGSLSQEPETVG